MTARRAPTSVLVIGGYLGAGKTTVLNGVLAAGTRQSTLVVVNDFGAVSVDAALLEATDGSTITLTNGCACCQAASSIVETFAGIAERRPPPSLVLLEASGVADPRELARHAMTPGFCSVGVVTVVDGTTVGARVTDPRVGRLVRRQLEVADLALVTKLDLVDGATAARALEEVNQLVSAGTEVKALQGAVGLEELVPRSPRPQLLDVPSRLAAAEVTFDRYLLSANGPVSPGVLETWVASLGPEVVRAKGVVEGPASEVLVVQWAPPHLEISSSSSKDVTGIVVITTHGSPAPPPLPVLR